MFRTPAPATLAKYGLSLGEWEAMLVSQGSACGVCARSFVELDLSSVIDHQHVAGWKKMTPENRKKYVRGICCISCNHFVLTRYGTIEKFLGAAEYIRRYEARRAT